MASDILLKHAEAAVQKGLDKKELTKILKTYGYGKKEIDSAYRRARLHTLRKTKQLTSIAIIVLVAAVVFVVLLTLNTVV